MIEDLMILGLAIWRLSSLLGRERGPFDVFVAIRRRAGISHDPDGAPSQWPSTYLPELLTCVFCLSVVLAIGSTVAWAFWPLAVRLIAMPFALSAVAILVERGINGRP